MNWGTGAYSSGPTPVLSISSGETQSAQVLDNNEGIFDGIILSRTNRSLGEQDFYENSFSVALLSRILTWQTGFDFPTQLGMPPTDPIFGPITEFDFRNYYSDGRNYTGYFGGGTITSLVNRVPTAVGEPASAALFAMGLVGFFTRRRLRNRSDATHWVIVRRSRGSIDA